MNVMGRRSGCLEVAPLRAPGHPGGRQQSGPGKDRHPVRQHSTRALARQPLHGLAKRRQGPAAGGVVPTLPIPPQSGHHGLALDVEGVLVEERAHDAVANVMANASGAGIEAADRRRVRLPCSAMMSDRPVALSAAASMTVQWRDLSRHSDPNENT